METRTDEHLADLEANVTAATARADAAEADCAKLRTTIADIEADIMRRADALLAARAVLGDDTRFDGLSDVEMKRAVVRAEIPAMYSDTLDGTRLDALFDVAVLEHGKKAKVRRVDAAGHADIRAGLLGRDPMRDVRERQYADSRDAWKQPLSHTRDNT